MTNSINSFLNSNSFPNKLEQFNTILDKAQAKITFCGRGVIAFCNNSETEIISLNKITIKIFNAEQERYELGDLTFKERIVGIEIIKKLRTFYEINDKEIANRNFFTRLFNVIWEVFTDISLLYGIRFELLEDIGDKFFQRFKAKDFTQIFGNKKDSFGLLYTNSIGTGNGELVSEDRIRSMALKKECYFTKQNLLSYVHVFYSATIQGNPYV